MAWEEATYIVNKVKGTLTPMLTNLQTNLTNSVKNTMNDAINNVLVPKLPDNRDPLQFSTVQKRQTNAVWSTPSFDKNLAIFQQTSGLYQTPVIGHYRYSTRSAAPEYLGEIINGKGKVILWKFNTYAIIDGTATYDGLSTFYRHEGYWTDLQDDNVELTFNKSIRVYTPKYLYGDINPATHPLSFVGSSDDFNFTTSDETTKTSYRMQAYNRALENLRKGYDGANQNILYSYFRTPYLLYLV